MTNLSFLKWILTLYATACFFQSGCQSQVLEPVDPAQTDVTETPEPCTPTPVFTMPLESEELPEYSPTPHSVFDSELIPIETNSPTASSVSQKTKSLTTERAQLSNEASGGSQVVITEGLGTILSDDIASARDSAISDAQRKAIEQVAGVSISSNTVIVNELLSKDFLECRSLGVIVNFEILDESQDANDLYKIRARVTVSLDPIEKLLYGKRPDHRATVLIFSATENRSTRNRSVENDIASTLQSINYILIDSDVFAGKLQIKSGDVSNWPDPSELRKAGLDAGAGIVILGTVNTLDPNPSLGNYSCHAHGDLKLVDVRTDQTLWNYQITEADPAIGFGKSPQEAEKGAESDLGLRFSKEIKRLLTLELGKDVLMRIRGLRDREQLRHMRNQVKNLRFVASVDSAEYEFNAWITVMRVKILCDLDSFMRELSQLDRISVVATSGDEIEIEMN